MSADYDRLFHSSGDAVQTADDDVDRDVATTGLGTNGHRRTGTERIDAAPDARRSEQQYSSRGARHRRGRLRSPLRCRPRVRRPRRGNKPTG